MLKVLMMKSNLLKSKPLVKYKYLKFLISNIVAEDKNRKLKDEVETLKIEVLKIDPNFKFWEEENSLNVILPSGSEKLNNTSMLEKLDHPNSSFTGKNLKPDTITGTGRNSLADSKKAQQQLRGAQSVPKLDFSHSQTGINSAIGDEIKDINKLRKELEHQKQINE